MITELSEKNLNEVALPEDRPHHPTSPSKLQSVEWCPCYDNYERDTPHAMTVRGTAQHDVVESGEIPEDMSDEDAVMAMEKRQYVQDRIQLLLEKFPGNVRMLTEEYLPIDDKPNEDASGKYFNGTTAGYLDCGLVFNGDTEGEIHDWKFGNWAVEPARNNTQGMSYALGMVKRYPKMKGVHVFFHVPRVSRTPDNRYFTREELEERCRPRIEAIVSRAVAARRTGDYAMARPGYPVCAFCANIAKCPAIAKRISTVAEKYSAIKVPDDINPLKVLQKEDQTAAMHLTHVVGAWAVAFKNRIKDRILEGKAKCPSDFTLVRQSKREIVDKDKLRDVVVRFVTTEGWRQLIDSVTPSFEQIEKELRSRTDRGRKDAMVKELNEALEEAKAVQKQPPVAFLRAKRTSSKDQSTP